MRTFNDRAPAEGAMWTGAGRLGSWRDGGRWRRSYRRSDYGWAVARRRPRPVRRARPRARPTCGSRALWRTAHVSRHLMVGARRRGARLVLGMPDATVACRW